MSPKYAKIYCKPKIQSSSCIKCPVWREGAEGRAWRRRRAFESSRAAAYSILPPGESHRHYCAERTSRGKGTLVKSISMGLVSLDQRPCEISYVNEFCSKESGSNTYQCICLFLHLKYPNIWVLLRVLVGREWLFVHSEIEKRTVSRFHGKKIETSEVFL